ncbi:y4mF family transcriptional regulator [Lachnospiraceae bacterium PF1-21]
MTKYPKGYKILSMNTIGKYVKEKRKSVGLTQEEFALRAGLGLRFVRELEQGKETVRLDKVNQALAMFGMEAVPGKLTREGVNEE